MNFSQVIKEDDISVELKYCERCGGLWLRPLNNDESYCESCRAMMAAWPQAERYFRRRRTPGTSIDSGAAMMPDLLVVDTLLGISETASQHSEIENWSDAGEVAL